jgi:CheY-like chemotaxis protein
VKGTTLTGNKKFVLLVDDDKDFAKLLKIYFERSGFEFEAVTSGKKALKAVQARMPDLMVLDIMMPKMDGVEVCTKLRAMLGSRRLPVIALTAYDSSQIKEQIMAVGADLYLTKPIEMNDLVTHVNRLIP